MRKMLSIVIIACFMVTSVFGEAIHAVAGTPQETEHCKNVADDLIIPSGCGRVTSACMLGSRQVVVNIQDLHCHAEVQRNIAKIIAALDAKYGLKNVYVEGGYGNIDISRLCNIQDTGLKNEIVENLVNEGRLTGAEYYAIGKGRTDLLKGIEDEALHKATIVQLGRILEKKEACERTASRLEGDLELMKAKYFSRRNREFTALVELHRTGKLSSRRYYRQLSKYVAMINSDPDAYGTIVSLSMGDYPNMTAYLALADQERQLDYQRTGRQMQDCMRLLKSRLPFSVYSALVENTDGFSKPDVLYASLAKLTKEYGVDVTAQYPDLAKFLAYTRQNQALDPLAMLREEKELVGEIRLGLSRSTAELDVAFIADFYPYFKDYLLTKLSIDDYEYVQGRFEKFVRLWGRYAPADRMAGLTDTFVLLNEYYRDNIERNTRFLAHIPLAVRGGNVQCLAPSQGRQLQEALANGEIIVLVTGGFHTGGLQQLLQERGISCCTVTPNVTQNTDVSDVRYDQFARAQAALLSQSLQLGLISQCSSPALFTLALKAANRRLADNNALDREKLVAAIATSIGVAVTYDPASGIVTFDNGAQLRLAADGAHSTAEKVTVASSVSGAVRASIEALLGTGALATALVKALAGDADDFMILAAKVAAEHYLFTGNGLPYEIANAPALSGQDRVDGIEREVLARFPEPVARAIAGHQARQTALATAAQRAGWLRVLLAVDLLRDHIIIASPEPRLQSLPDAVRPTSVATGEGRTTSRLLRSIFGKNAVTDAIDELFIAPFLEWSRFASLFAAYPDVRLFDVATQRFFEEHGYGRHHDYRRFYDGIAAIMEGAATANVFGVSLSGPALAWGHFIYNLKERKRGIVSAHAGRQYIPVSMTLGREDAAARDQRVKNETRRIDVLLQGDYGAGEREVATTVAAMKNELLAQKYEQADEWYAVLNSLAVHYPREIAGQLLAALQERRAEASGDALIATWLGQLIVEIGCRNPALAELLMTQNDYASEERLNNVLMALAETEPQRTSEFLIGVFLSKQYRGRAKRLLTLIEERSPGTLYNAFMHYLDDKDPSALSPFTWFLGEDSVFGETLIDVFFEVFKDNRDKVGPLVAVFKDDHEKVVTTAKEILIGICELGEGYCDFPRPLTKAMMSQNPRVVRTAGDVLIEMYYLNPNLEKEFPIRDARIRRSLQLLTGEAGEITDGDLQLLSYLSSALGPDLHLAATARIKEYAAAGVAGSAAMHAGQQAQNDSVASDQAPHSTYVQEGDGFDNWLFNFERALDGESARREQAAKRNTVPQLSPLLVIAYSEHPAWVDRYLKSKQSSRDKVDARRLVLGRTIVQELQLKNEKELLRQENERQEADRKTVSGQIGKAVDELLALFAARKTQQEGQPKKQDKKKQQQKIDEPDQAEKEAINRKLAAYFGAHPLLYMEIVKTHKDNDKLYRALIAVAVNNAAGIEDAAQYRPFLDEVLALDAGAVQRIYRHREAAAQNPSFVKVLFDFMAAMHRPDPDLIMEYISAENAGIGGLINDDATFMQLLALGDAVLSAPDIRQGKTEKFKALALPLAEDALSTDMRKFAPLLSLMANDTAPEKQHPFSFSIYCLLLANVHHLFPLAVEAQDGKDVPATAEQVIKLFDHIYYGGNASVIDTKTKNLFLLRLQEALTAFGALAAEKRTTRFEEKKDENLSLFSRAIARHLLDKGLLEQSVFGVEGAFNGVYRSFDERQLFAAMKAVDTSSNDRMAIAYHLSYVWTQELLDGVSADIDRVLNGQSLDPATKEKLVADFTFLYLAKVRKMPVDGDLVNGLKELLSTCRLTGTPDEEKMIAGILNEKNSPRDRMQLAYQLAVSWSEEDRHATLTAIMTRIHEQLQGVEDPEVQAMLLWAFVRIVSPDDEVVINGMYAAELEEAMLKVTVPGNEDGQKCIDEQLLTRALFLQTVGPTEYVKWRILLLFADLTPMFTDLDYIPNELREEVTQPKEEVRAVVRSSLRTLSGSSLIGEISSNREMVGDARWIFALSEPERAKAVKAILQPLLNKMKAGSTLADQMRKTDLAAHYVAVMPELRHRYGVSVARQTGDDRRLVLPRNMPLALRGKLEGKPDWLIALTIVVRERLSSFFRPFSFYRAHRATPERLRGMVVIAALNYIPVVAASFLAASGFGAAALAAGLATGMIAGGTVHWLWDWSSLKELRGTTVTHIARHEDLARLRTKFNSSADYTQVWFTDLPGGARRPLSPLGFRVDPAGAAAPVDVWVGVDDGSLVFYMDLKKAGIADADYGRVLAEGAAQVTRVLGGTDTSGADEGLQRYVRDIGRSGSVEVNGIAFTPAMIIDYTQDPAQVKQAFSDEGINKAVIVPAAQLSAIAPAKVNAAIGKILARRKALSTTMGECKILEMDVADFDEFRKALRLFNAVGNGQMMIDDTIIQTALRDKKITKAALKELLSAAKKAGVAVYCKGISANETSFLRLGFAGVISPDRLTGVQLNNLGARKFDAQEILDVRIPASMSEKELREAFEKLPLANTIIFHSADADKLVRTRDIESDKAFTSLLSLLLNFGKAAITTPATARRLGYNWDVSAVQGEARLIAALAAGRIEESGMAPDTALYEQAMELAPELRSPFLTAVAAKLLIVNAMRQKDGQISREYALGKYRFTNPRQEEMLGDALLLQSKWTPAQLRQDRVAEVKLKTSAQDNLDAFLEKMYAGIKDGQPQEGALTAVIDSILMDAIAEYTMKASMKRKQGTLDLRTVNSILGAA